MIEVKKGEYCVAEVAKKDADGNEKGPRKLTLMKVTGFSGGGDEVIGRVENLPHIKEVQISVPPKNIVLGLGKRPRAGKVYGFDVSQLYLGSREHDTFGDLHFFTRPEDQAVNALWSALDSVHDRLKKHGLTRLLDLPCVYEVVPKSGKYAGKYIHSGDIEKTPGRIQVSVGEEVLEAASLGNYTYVMAHELGHLAHFQCLADYPKLNAKWIELYATTIKPRVIEAERCVDLGKMVMANPETGLKGFYSEADDETKSEIKLILKWIKEVKGVTVRELDLLLQADSKSASKAFKASWPQVDVVSKDLKPVISDYACKNWRETFSEAFAFYLCGKKLPDPVVELVESSFSIIRNHLKTQLA